jgi:hypothetical protein
VSVVVNILLAVSGFSDRFPTELVSPTNISTYGTLVVSVSGRTRPKGVHIHPIVWLQMFDYAKGTKHILISESNKHSEASDLVFTNYFACIITSFYPKLVTKRCSSVLIIDTFGIH